MSEQPATEDHPDAEPWECVVCGEKQARDDGEDGFPPEGWDVTNASRFEGRCGIHALGNPREEELQPLSDDWAEQNPDHDDGYD